PDGEHDRAVAAHRGRGAAAGPGRQDPTARSARSQAAPARARCAPSAGPPPVVARMTLRVRRSGTALVLGFAGGLLAPIMFYLLLTQFGSAQAASNPARPLPAKTAANK